jgi:NAD(P)-dependent dehydrogenase (short-subunit alcohol dehydrogenase family)
MIADGLVRRGVKTYIAGRNPEQISGAAAALSLQGGDCIGIAAELADANGPAYLAAEVARRESALHILVNNAGANATGSLAEMAVEDWDVVMNVNVRAAFFLTQSLLPLLRAAATDEDPARVVNVGSIGGLHIPNWEAHAYNTSKAAIHHLTRSLCKALGADRITVNAIAPGPFPSRLTDTGSEAVKKSVATYVPLGRPGTPEDAQGAVVFLASRAGAYVNGAVIPLDGGYIAAL